MLEIRFHGRGGQGTVLAAKILADIVLRSGKGECMAIPEFGVERRGAPVMAYARISESNIRERTRIYNPDAVVLLDPTLTHEPAVVKGLKPGGLILVNTDNDSAAMAGHWPGFRVVCVPARRIAVERKLGSAASPVVNTAICGAIAAIFKLADEAVLEATIREAVPVQHDANVAAALEAYRFCRERQYASA